MWSACYGKEKTPSPAFIHLGAREKAINPSPSGMRPTAHQARKIGNQVPTEGAKQENQINTQGGIKRKTLAEGTNYNKIEINCYNHYETQSNRQ